MSERTLITLMGLALAGTMFLTQLTLLAHREDISILNDRVEEQRLQIMDLERGQ